MIRPSLDEFSRDCEFDAPLRLCVARATADSRGQGASRVVTAPGAFAVVGTDPRCDVVLDDPAVDPRHCYLQAFGPMVLCVDLGAGRGVDAGAGRTAAAWIDGGRGARIGDTVVRLARPGRDGTTGPGGSRVELNPARPPLEDEPLLSGQLPRVNLEFQSGDVRTVWRVKRAISLIGRAAPCAVKLNGPGVARFHAALVLTTAGLWVVDLLGELESPWSSGVLVDGVPVRFARLGTEEVLTIDRFHARARYEASGRPGPQPPVAPRRVGATAAADRESPADTLGAIRREFQARLEADRVAPQRTGSPPPRPGRPP